MKKIAAILTVASLLLVASPAAAFNFGGGSSSDINVEVENKDTYVKNDVETKADTGDNSSTGGDATSRAKAEAKSGDADAASEANGGKGGSITTGDATAQAFVLNDVNNNNVKVQAGCSCRRGGDIDVEVENKDTTVKNYVDTKATTGDNSSTGGDADSKAKAEGGKSKTSRFSWFSHHNNNNGGDADAWSEANGGKGGSVVTGDADSYSDVTNYVNTNVVRVRR